MTKEEILLESLNDYKSSITVRKEFSKLQLYVIYSAMENWAEIRNGIVDNTNKQD